MSHADEKGLCSSMFGMWFMHNGITHLISLPRLEMYRFRATYGTLKSWVVHFPDGTPIFFKWDAGLCDQLPYVDLEYLNTIKCESVSMLQTGRGDYEGFSKRGSVKV